jgi:hypothetical protein
MAVTVGSGVEWSGVEWSGGCRLLGYKNPVRTSQETHYLSATSSALLMLCRIIGFHGGDHEECRILGC